MLSFADLVNAGDLFFIIGGVFVAALLIGFFVFIRRSDGENHIKSAYLKESFRGTIDDITNPKEGDEIKDKKR